MKHHFLVLFVALAFRPQIGFSLVVEVDEHGFPKADTLQERFNKTREISQLRPDSTVHLCKIQRKGTFGKAVLPTFAGACTYIKRDQKEPVKVDITPKDLEAFFAKRVALADQSSTCRI